MINTMIYGELDVVGIDTQQGLGKAGNVEKYSAMKKELIATLVT